MPMTDPAPERCVPGEARRRPVAARDSVARRGPGRSRSEAPRQERRARRSRSAFPMTVTDDTLMAALAIMGESSHPAHG